MRPAGTFVIGDVARQKLSNGPINCLFRIDESGLLSMSAAQEAACSQVPFSMARFSLQLHGSRGTIHQSICAAMPDGQDMRLIDASTRAVILPAAAHETFVPQGNGEREMEFKLYEGNSLSVRRLTFVGSLSVALPALRSGVPVVHLSVSVDRSYLLNATATCIPPAQVEQLIVVPNQWELPFTVMQKLAKELADKRAASKAKDALHLLCYDLGLKIEDLEKAGHSSATFDRLTRKRTFIINELGRRGLRTADEYEEYKKDLETLSSAMGLNGTHSLSALIPGSRKQRHQLTSFHESRPQGPPAELLAPS